MSNSKPPSAKPLSFSSDNDAAMDELSLEVLDECRKTLLMSMRFLDVALWRMPFSSEHFACTLATDGSRMYFDAARVLLRFRSVPNEMIRDYLHAILHCVFHHPFDENVEDHDAWFLCCDISAEATAMELVGQRFPSCDDDARREAIERIVAQSGALTPHALYKVLRKGAVGEAVFTQYSFSHSDLRRFAVLFARDSHQAWAFNRERTTERVDNGDREDLGDVNRSEKIEDPDTPSIEFAQAPEQQDADDQGQNEGSEPDVSEDAVSGEGESQSESIQDAEDTAAQGAKDAQESSGQQQGSDDQQISGQTDEELDKAVEEWTDISKRIEADLESFSKAQGNGAGSMMAALAIANRKPCDYNEFLRKFATMAEDMKLNDDEFDYIFYTYGMEHYDRMPFIEPLEYKESNRIREFVIALDTSGSCSGDLIRTFVTRTYDVLRQTEGFGDKVNVHIVQCDNRIQSDTKITSVAELENFRDSFWVKGFGGTDFRPLFEYVDAMVADGEFEDLRGLIYFTDGLGTFPSRAPAYETAFVFVDNTGGRIAVPPWAMKVVMTEEEIVEGR